MSKIVKVETDFSPKAIGPYSQAVIAGDFIFCSGQIAIETKSGEIIPGGIIEQTKQTIKNLENILVSTGNSLGQVVRTEVYLKNMDDFGEMNKIYSEKFIFEPKPSRVTVEVSRLPKDALIEISCIAINKIYEK